MIQTKPVKTERQQHILDDQPYDVIVMGGGPAGSSTAALVAQYGHRVLLLEREAIPRFHVGESLIPRTYDTLNRLGLIERLKNSAFPKKYSVQFVTEGGKITAPFYFDEYMPHESSVTWQVERGDFDQLLIERAIELGAHVRTDAHIMDVLFENEKAVGVKVKLSQGGNQGTSEIREIKAKIIVDATGQSALIMNKLGLKQQDKRLKKGTVWTYFKNALRDTGKDEGATIIMQTEGKKSWFWYIPLTDNVVSIGCTGSMSYMFGDKSMSAEDVYQRELERCPELQRRLQHAERVADYLTTRDFSYRSKNTAGDGWLMVGDAFGFIDPVYSSGVFLALASGNFASTAIHDAICENDFSACKLGSWNEDYLKGLNNFKKLVYAFYTPDFSFGKFFMKYPEYRNHMTDILMGDVFKPGVEDIFKVMGEVLPPSDVEEPVLIA